MLCAFAMRAMKTMRLMISGSVSTRTMCITLVGVQRMPGHLFLQSVSRINFLCLTALGAVTLICLAPCGLPGCKNKSTPFPGRMSYKATKPGFVRFISWNFLLSSCLLRSQFIVFVVCVLFLIVLVMMSVLTKLAATFHVDMSHLLNARVHNIKTCCFVLLFYCSS